MVNALQTEREIYDATNAELQARKAAFNAPNPSGVRPLDNRVLVKPDNVETVTKGGIILIDTEKEQMAQVRGTLIAAGVNAWAEAAATSPEFEMPQPGTRVLIAKYGGIQIDGDDGEKYRIMNDLDITAILETTHGA